MRIFNHEQDATHPLFRALQDMHASKSAPIKAMACNMSHEAKVSLDREQEFLKLIGTCDSQAAFEKCWKDYISQRIKITDNPEFGKTHNSVNAVPPFGERLVCIFLINGLGAMFRWVRNERYSLPVELQPFAKAFIDYPNVDSPFFPDSIDFVNKLMTGEEERTKFIQAVFRLYELYRVENHYHPMWLTKWRSFEDIYRIKDGDRWCHLVGVSTERKSKMWVIALVFRPEDLGVLYRPTVLDGDSSFFFPTPEGAITSGLAADLKMAVEVPACEYITVHPSLQVAALDYVDGCVQLQEPPEGTVEAVRKYHIGCLRNEFKSPEASAWIDRVAGDWIEP